MMISYTLNCPNYGIYTEMTDPSSNVYSADEDESKLIIVHEDLSQNFSTNEGESKRSIINENLGYNYSTNVNKLCSTEKDISEYTITERKDAEYN